MEEHWSLSNDKLISAEEGLKLEIRKNAKQGKICEQFVQIIKIVLYFQLICFVAWGGYAFWQAYNQHENIHFYISYSNYSSSSESSKVLNESSTLPLNNVEKTLERMTTTNIPFQRDALGNKILHKDDQLVTITKILDSSSDKDDISIISSEEKSDINPFENTSTYKPIKDSSELQIDDYKNSVEDTVSSSKIMENKDKENSMDQAVLEWDVPLFSILSIDDSLKETRNSEPKTEPETEAAVKEVLGKFEDLKEESDFNSDEYDISKEIELEKKFQSLLDLLLKDLPDNYSSSISDDFVETTESSMMDEGSEGSSPNVVVSEILENWKQDSTEASVFISEEDPEEKTKSSLFHDRLIEKEEEEEDPYDYLKGNHGHGYFDPTFPFVKSVDSEKSDTSKVEDDATSDLNSQFWKRSSFLREMSFPILDWRIQDSSIETSKTEEESTERNISTEMSTTSNKQHIDNIFNTRLWEFHNRDNVDPSVFSSTENVDFEKEIEGGQIQKNYTCIEDIMYGFKVLKCHYNPFQPSNEEQDLNIFKDSDDRSFVTPFIELKEEDYESARNILFLMDPLSVDPPDSPEYVNDDTNNGIIDQEPIQESMDFTNSESENPDILIERWTKMKPSTDVYFQENSYQDTEDPIRWWLDLSRYEKQPMFDD